MRGFPDAWLEKIRVARKSDKPRKADTEWPFGRATLIFPIFHQATDTAPRNRHFPAVFPSIIRRAGQPVTGKQKW